MLPRDPQPLIPIRAGHMRHDQAQPRKALENRQKVIGHPVHIVARPAAQRTRVAQNRQPRLFEPRVERQHPRIRRKEAPQPGMHLDALRAEPDAALQLLHQRIGIAPDADIAADEGDDARLAPVQVQNPAIEIPRPLAQLIPDLVLRQLGIPAPPLIEHIRQHHVVHRDQRLQRLSVQLRADPFLIRPAPLVGIIRARKHRPLLRHAARHMHMHVDDLGQHCGGRFYNSGLRPGVHITLKSYSERICSGIPALR